MHKYVPGMHKGRVRVTSDYLLYLEIRGVRRSEGQRAGIREGFILEEGGRQLRHGKMNTHHFIICF